LPAGAQLGDFKRIQQNIEIKVDKVKIVPTGSTSSLLFVHALPTVGTAQLGWTSSRNLRDKFVNVTLGALPPPPGAERHGPNATWSGGAFTGQITVVQIMDVKNEVKRIAIDTLDPYMALVTAAASDGVRVGINSAFRSYPEQRILYDGYQRGLPGFNKAAPPGHSNHQNGIAFDIAVGGGSGDPTYDWLKKNAPARGFVRTVTGEPWHWEYDRASYSRGGGTYLQDAERGGLTALLAGGLQQSLAPSAALPSRIA
jgi:D-alanyl-D-alanine carboxypeptidase